MRANILFFFIGRPIHEKNIYIYGLVRIGPKRRRKLLNFSENRNKQWKQSKYMVRKAKLL